MVGGREIGSISGDRKTLLSFSCVLACICPLHIPPPPTVTFKRSLLHCNVYLSSSSAVRPSQRRLLLPPSVPPACSMQAATIGGDSVDAAEERGTGRAEGGEADVSPNGRRVSEPPTDFSCFGRLIGAEFKGGGGGGGGGYNVKSLEGLPVAVPNDERKLTYTQYGL